MSLNLAYGWSVGVLLRSTRCFFVPIAALFLSVLTLVSAQQPASAQTSEEDLRPLIQALAEGSFDDKADAIKALAATGDPAVARVLEVMREGDLYQRKSDDLVVITERDKRERILFDPITGDELETVRSPSAVSKIKVNNRLRRQIDGALGALTLMSADRGVRIRAARAVFDRANVEQLESVRTALEAEQDTEIANILAQAEAAMVLKSEEPLEAKLAAVDVLKARGDRAAMAQLRAVAADDTMPELQESTLAAVAAIERRYEMLSMAQNVYYGLSLGSSSCSPRSGLPSPSASWA